MRIVMIFVAALGLTQAHAQGWPSYGGDDGASKFSSLTQITPDNVNELEVAWSYRTGEGEGPVLEVGNFGLQVTPILLHQRSASEHAIGVDQWRVKKAAGRRVTLQIRQVAGKSGCSNERHCNAIQLIARNHRQRHSNVRLLL